MLCQKGPDLSDFVLYKPARSSSLCNVLFDGQLVGVWRDTYSTRRDTRLGSREQDNIFLDFLSKKILNDEMYREKIVFYSTEKHKMQFWNQLILYENKLIF